jgi:nucleotide-binding universal stress UspA family protein
MHAGPVIVSFDGTPASVRAVSAAADLLAPRRAIVVVVWEAGRNFEVATLPERALEEPPTTLDAGAAFGAEEAAADDAQQLAEHGAQLAREAGLQAEGLAVADDAGVADTLIRLAREHDAQALVVGAHHHRGFARLTHDGTLASLLHGAPCPVIVCDEEPRGAD